MRKTILLNAKEIHEIHNTLDPIDMCLIEYIRDCCASSGMKKTTHNGHVYTWVAYSKILNDMPYLQIKNKQSIARRMRKIAESGLVIKHIDKEMGSQACWRMSQKYDEMIGLTEETTTKKRPPSTFESTPLDVSVQPPSTFESTYISISDNSIKNNYRADGTEARVLTNSPPKSPSKKDKEKEINMANMINDDINTDKFRAAWSDWCAACRERKKPMTATRAKYQINKLNKMGHDDAILSIEQSIENGYQGLFDPKKQNKEPERKEHPWIREQRLKREAARALA